MKTDYTSLLDQTIVLEGLLRVAISRNLPEDELLAMLSRHSLAISDALALTDSPVASETSSSPVAPLAPEAVEAPETPEVPETHETPEVTEAPETPEVHETPETPEAPEATETPEAPAPPVRLEDKVASQAAGSLMHLFSLNDRFRFSRELFDGSLDSFNETLEVLTEMGSLDEAREYITDDLCLDATSPDVTDFLAIVAKHFA